MWLCFHLGLVQAVKQRRKGRLVRIEVHPRFGEAVPECPYTVCVERLNGVLRDRLACLTRKTHAFAKREQTWDAAVGLCPFEHNWIRPLQALREVEPDPSTGRRYRRRSPAMALGLSDDLWSWTEFLSQPCRG